MPPGLLMGQLPLSEERSRLFYSVQEPIEERNRIPSIDALRGFALLGILTVNIQSFAMVSGDHWSPTADGDAKFINFWIWIVTHVLADAKFMAIFSMLFGAGIMLMTQRLEARGVPPAAIHYRRMGVLVLIGVAHSYLLWSGDVLVAYGLCGSLAYLGRKLSSGKLLIMAFLLIAFGAFLFRGYTHPTTGLFHDALAVGRESLGIPLSISPSAETVAYRGTWLAQMSVRRQSSLESEIVAFVVITLWRVTGLMLVGMALMKLGFLNVSRKLSVYRWALGAGFCVGISLALLGTFVHFVYGWTSPQGIFLDYNVNYWASLFVSLGWVGALMLLTRVAALQCLIRAFAALGRTALTNYLLQTIICTTIFYGHGFGSFGRMDRVGQSATVVAIWILELIVSSLWVRRFQFGPMEWMWRSLTYMRREPFLRTPAHW